MVVNFIFLFALAVFPYSVQSFLKFERSRGPFALYLGDIVLVFVTLSILRVRGLRQRRHETDLPGRVQDWRRSVTQVAIAFLLVGLLFALTKNHQPLPVAAQQYGVPVLALMAATAISIKLTVRRLPEFLT